MATLIKIDRNGSKHFEGIVECDKCGGTGTYTWGGTINGVAMYSGVCFKCGGSGKLIDRWIERTPEYQAKLDEKREAKRAERIAAHEAERAKREAERAAREAEEAARKAVSQYVGNPGDKLNIKVTFAKRFHYEAPKYGGFGTETRTVYLFTDGKGNKLVWNTSASLGRETTDERGFTNFYPVEEGEEITIRATVKKLGEYRGERQTELQRVKLV
jgi:hypothetical protein